MGRSRRTDTRLGRRSRATAAALVAGALLVPAGAAAGAGPDCARARGDELTCLACNVYHEARNQSLDGQLAVAMVTLNRVRAPDRPKTICGVVWEQGRDFRTGRMVAQFSWTLDGKSDRVEEPAAWSRALEVARRALRSTRGEPVPDPSRGATFFHASYVEPDWRHDRGMTFLTQIDDHLFYRLEASGGGLGGGKLRAGPAERHPSWIARGTKLLSLPASGEGRRVRIVEGGQARWITVRREPR